MNEMGTILVKLLFSQGKTWVNDVATRITAKNMMYSLLYNVL